ncbi:hypothetical protein Tco_1066053 [Tanacetum coccineum]
MANLNFCDKHNMVAFLQKPTGSEEFHQIVDFLVGSHIMYALTTNPTIYVSLIEPFWQTATVKTVNDGEQQISVTVDGQTIAIQESFKKLRTAEASSSEPIQEQPTEEPKELSKEKLKKMLEIVPVEEIKAEALQVKYPIIN